MYQMEIDIRPVTPKAGAAADGRAREVVEVEFVKRDHAHRVLDNMLDLMGVPE